MPDISLLALPKKTMDLAFTEVPTLVSVSFGLFMFFIPPWLICRTVRRTLAHQNTIDNAAIGRKIVTFYSIYFLIIGGVACSGFFAVNTLPPRIILFSVIPLFLFYLVAVPRLAWFKAVYERVRLEQLIQIHMFRLVGAYFFILYAYDALPWSFALIGGAGDIATAVLIIPTVYFLKKKRSFSKALAWCWNIFGLLDILCVLVTAVALTRLAVENQTMGVGQFGTFPFSWIPAFAPATIVFLHILTFKKLLAK